MEAPVWDVTHNAGVNRANVGGGGGWGGTVPLEGGLQGWDEGTQR